MPRHGIQIRCVTIRISHSCLNCKDGLASTGEAPVVRRFPMIPGIDFAGMMSLAGKLPARWLKKAGAAPCILL